jgi:hypothetical protein
MQGVLASAVLLADGLMPLLMPVRKRGETHAMATVEINCSACGNTDLRAWDSPFVMWDLDISTVIVECPECGNLWSITLDEVFLRLE